ncbi:discoidin domain-containing protein [Listeria costaricensis]|uniref:discoidin domain-containing protein n=1 Tax=Listeria costaricensis TaxID=2026604 RepID=UPI000C08D758|nr:discoidin domain-containing protein [Listeria costaricensis]
MKKCLQITLITGLIWMSFASVWVFVSPQTVHAESSKATEIAQIENIMAGFQNDATWTDTQYKDAITGRLPSTALLGNGEVGVTSYGNATEKTYLLSSNSFWSDNTRYFGYRGRSPQIMTGGGLTVKAGVARHPYDLAYQMKTTDSGAAADHGSNLAVGGLYTNDLADGADTFSGFVSDNASGKAWMTVQLQGYEKFDRYVIRHDNYTSKKGTDRNTRDFRMQILPGGLTPETAAASDWQTIDEVKNNTADESDRQLAQAVQAKYVRLQIDQATAESGDQIARVGQIELYNGEKTYKLPVENNAPSTHPYDLAYGMPVEASSELAGHEAEKAVSGAYEWEDQAQSKRFEGWVSAAGNEQTLTVDLKRETTFNRWVVKHNNSTAKNGGDYNTRDFSLEISTDGNTWKKVDEVKGNLADVTNRALLYPYKARYVRLHITKPESQAEGSARISQFELYNDNNAENNLAKDSEITASSTMKDRTTADLVNDNWQTAVKGYNDYSGWISNPGMPQNVIFDLKTEQTFQQVGLVHAGCTGLVDDLTKSGNPNAANYARFNTKGAEILVSPDKTNWQKIGAVTNNTAGISTITLDAPVTARYVKLNVTQGEQSGAASNQRARIAKFYLFENTGYTLPIDAVMPVKQTDAVESTATTKSTNLKASNSSFNEHLDILKAEVNTDMTIGGAQVEMNTWLSQEQNLLFTTITSKSDKDQALEIDAWMKDSLEYQTPATGDNTTASKPETTVATGQQGAAVWATRRSNINDDVVTLKGETRQTTYKARFMSEMAVATKVVGAEAGTDYDENSGNLYVNLPKGESITLVTAVETAANQQVDAAYGKDGKALSGAMKQLANINSQQDVAKEREQTLNWWEDYYLKSYVDTGDTKLNKVYYGSQYIFGSATRSGETAPGLYGPWITTDHANWQGDYHLNYNFQSPYYGSYSSNRLKEFSDPMFYETIRYMDTGKKLASNPEELQKISPWYYSTRANDEAFKNGFQDAVLYPVGVTPFEDLETGNYLNQTLDALFSATQILAYYEYTLDDEWLFKKIDTTSGSYSPYEYLISVANFYEQWIEKRDPRVDNIYVKDNPSGINGNAAPTQYTANYAKYPAYSGGKDYTYVLFDGSHEGSFEFNPTVTVGNLQYLMDSLVKIGERNEMSQTSYADWKDISEHLVKPETSIYSYNASTSWKSSSAYFGKDIFGLSEDRYVRPISATVNLEFIMPGEQLSFDSDPYLLEVARNTVAVMGNDGTPGWSMVNNTPKIFTQAARVGYDPVELRSKITTYVANKMDKNYYVNDNTHGWEKAGVIEALDSMMVANSQNGIVKLFPVWPENTNGEFKRIRAKGAFLISAQMKDNTVANVTITSEKGEKMKLVNPWGESDVTVRDQNNQVIKTSQGKTANSLQKGTDKKEQTIEFATKAGYTYTITNEKTELEAPVISGEATVEITEGQDFDPLAGLTATDKEDGDLTTAIQVVTNDVNMSTPGTYHVTYEVMDSDGETATFERTVIVVTREDSSGGLKGSAGGKDSSKPNMIKPVNDTEAARQKNHPSQMTTMTISEPPSLSKQTSKLPNTGDTTGVGILLGFLLLGTAATLKNKR